MAIHESLESSLYAIPRFIKIKIEKRVLYGQHCSLINLNLRFDDSTLNIQFFV